MQFGAPAGRFSTYQQLGSYLHKDAVKKQRDLNFLHPDAHQHAEDRAKVVPGQGGSLESTRLFHNMLSSMPLCFNLFGAMRAEPGFLKVFKALFDDQASAITEILCEWAPEGKEAKIGDRTAFDAVVFYTANGEQRFCGIETKYTEPFSQTLSKNLPEYDDVMHHSGWFHDPDAGVQLRARASDQLWRNVMLAAKLDHVGSRGRGSVTVVALGDDKGAEKAVEIVGGALSDSHADRLRSVSIEQILETTEELAPDLGWWATSFRRRYVEAGLPDDPSAARDPLGPQLGRTLVETAGLARASDQRPV